MQLPMLKKSENISMTGTMTGKFEGPCKGDE
jgi:hypothetical protein